MTRRWSMMGGAVVLLLLACAWNRSRLQTLGAERDALRAGRASSLAVGEGPGSVRRARRESGDRVKDVAERYERLLREERFGNGNLTGESLETSLEVAALRRTVLGFSADELGRLIDRIGSGVEGDAGGRRSLTFSLLKRQAELDSKRVLTMLVDPDPSALPSCLETDEARGLKRSLLQSVMTSFGRERPLEASDWWEANRDQVVELDGSPSVANRLIEGVMQADAGLAIRLAWELERAGERVGWAFISDIVATDEGCLGTLDELRQMLDSGQLGGLSYGENFPGKSALLLQGHRISLKRMKGGLDRMGWTLAEVTPDSMYHIGDRLDERESAAWLDWLATQPKEGRAVWLACLATGDRTAERTRRWLDDLDDAAMAEGLVREALDSGSLGSALERARLARFLRDEEERAERLRKLMDSPGLTEKERRQLAREFGLSPGESR